MIKNNNLGALMGAPVLGKGDERIGTVGRIFVDPDTDVPNWMTVHTGLFGRHETFVPLQDAEWDHERVHVDIDKETIKAAPRIDTDQALSPEDEENLYRYYAVAAGGAQPAATSAPPAAEPGDARGRLKRVVVEPEPAAETGTGTHVAETGTGAHVAETGDGAVPPQTRSST